MKLTNRKIVTDAPYLSELMTRQLPVKVSYTLSKNVNKIENELNLYNQEKQKLVNLYCLKDENGEIKIDEDNQLVIDPNNVDLWNKEINELLDIEISIDIHKFKLDDLLNSNGEMSPAEISLIDYMIED